MKNLPDAHKPVKVCFFGLMLTCTVEVNHEYELIVPAVECENGAMGLGRLATDLPCIGHRVPDASDARAFPDAWWRRMRSELVHVQARQWCAQQKLMKAACMVDEAEARRSKQITEAVMSIPSEVNRMQHEASDMVVMPCQSRNCAQHLWCPCTNHYIVWPLVQSHSMDYIVWPF